MENIHIILIGLIIIILLIALIVFLKMKNNNETSKTSKDISDNVIILPKDISNNLLGKTIYVNIDEYNNIYNFNYHEGKVYKNIDLNTMSSTSATATVITDPETKEIYVNDKKVILYIAYIKYNVLNYGALINKTLYMKSDYMEKNNRINRSLSYSTVSKVLDTPRDTPLEITLEIVVTKPIKKNDTFTVYYKYGSTNEDRFIPPFLPEEYVTYF